MNVEILKTPDPACDGFVRGHPDGRLCFLPGWSDMVERRFGLESLYLAARTEGRVCGILPLVHARSFFFGNRLVSQAFVDYGGALAESAEACEALFRRAVELAEERRCESIEFRNVAPLPFDLVPRSDKIGMWLPLVADPEQVWKGLDAKVRNQVRKAEKSEIACASGGLELLEDFYGVYTVRMRQLGTPCYAKALMAGILETFPDNSRIFVVRLKETIVGAGITTFLGRFAEMQYASTLVEYNKLCPNNLLYWKAIEHYARAGAQYFDFGRSTVGGGTYDFKKQWECREVPLHYQYWVRPGVTLSEPTPDNPKYARKVEMWRKLPLWVTRVLGPRISRGLP